MHQPRRGKARRRGQGGGKTHNLIVEVEACVVELRAVVVWDRLAHRSAPQLPHLYTINQNQIFDQTTFDLITFDPRLIKLGLMLIMVYRCGFSFGIDLRTDPLPTSHTGTERDFFFDILLVRIHLIIEMILVDRPCAMGV